MNWEETIIYARKTDEYRQLVEDAYLGDDLKHNVEKFRSSEEFMETLNLVKAYHPDYSTNSQLTLLDLGAGNGISSIAFALKGFHVTAVEPDPSNTVGAGAIAQLKELYGLSTLQVSSFYGESLGFPESSFDIVYARQAMHHAADLEKFVKESSRILKPKGLLITCRDHVVNDEKQKEDFLNAHPFQKFYHGENAFSLSEYKEAFSKAGLAVLAELGHLDSVINYSPQTKAEITLGFKKILEQKLKMKWFNRSFFDRWIFGFFKWKTKNLNDFAGRLYSFVAQKN